MAFAACFGLIQGPTPATNPRFIIGFLTDPGPEYTQGSSIVGSLLYQGPGHTRVSNLARQTKPRAERQSARYDQSGPGPGRTREWFGKLAVELQGPNICALKQFGVRLVSFQIGHICHSPAPCRGQCAGQWRQPSSTANQGGAQGAQEGFRVQWSDENILGCLTVSRVPAGLPDLVLGAHFVRKSNVWGQKPAPET